MLETAAHPIVGCLSVASVYTPHPIGFFQTKSCPNES